MCDIYDGFHKIPAPAQTDRQTDRHVITISHFACILKGDQNRLDHSSLAEVINRFENVIVAATGCSGLIN